MESIVMLGIHEKAFEYNANVWRFALKTLFRANTNKCGIRNNNRDAYGQPQRFTRIHFSNKINEQKKLDELRSLWL